MEETDLADGGYLDIDSYLDAKARVWPRIQAHARMLADQLSAELPDGLHITWEPDENYAQREKRFLDLALQPWVKR